MQFKISTMPKRQKIQQKNGQKKYEQEEKIKMRNIRKAAQS